jgi:hypothetical protein
MGVPVTGGFSPGTGGISEEGGAGSTITDGDEPGAEAGPSVAGSSGAGLTGLLVFPSGGCAGLDTAVSGGIVGDTCAAFGVSVAVITTAGTALLPFEPPLSAGSPQPQVVLA